MPGRYWSEEEERKLADMVASGLSPYKIAKELPGRSVGAIREKIRRMGLVVVRGEGGSSTTRSLPSADILTHEQVLKVLAGALEKGKEPGLDGLEINRLNTLANLARTYDSILEKFERWVEIEQRMERIQQRLAVVEWREKQREEKEVEAPGPG